MILFALWSGICMAQEITIKNYSYRFVSTELSPKQAIQKAKKEALAACVQENLGVGVMNLTQFVKQQSDRDYSEKFSEFTQQISLGFIRKYRTKSTSSRFDEEKLALETTVVLDITIYKPKESDDLGLSATTGQSTFIDGDAATISYSVKEPSYIYIFDLNHRNQYCLIHETESKITENQKYIFPESSMPIELAMTKEAPDEFEFGSFVIMACGKPVNFQIKPAIKNQWKFECLDFDKFFGKINGIKSDHSIVYLPYCIETKKSSSNEK
jgi:hypothetical protein